MDAEEKPFSFELIKAFMDQVTARVLEKLRQQLASLKSESLNPVAIRANQAATKGTTASLLVGEQAADMMSHGRLAGGRTHGNLRSARVVFAPRAGVRGGGAGGLGGFIHRNQEQLQKPSLQKPSPRVGPTSHVLDAKKLHSFTTPRLCDNMPVRLYQG